MTLVAYPLSTPRAFAAAAPTTAARGFVELDDRVCSALAGVSVVRAPSHEAAAAIGAHVARRARSAGLHVLEARAWHGTPLWREVASRLGIGVLASDPYEAADTIARVAGQRRALVVGSLPAVGTWDRAVAGALSGLAAAPPVVLVCSGAETTDDLHAESYEIGATLDETERTRWWAALADAAQAEVSVDAVASLDAWWNNARRAPLARPTSEATLDVDATRVATLLALVGRAWPAADAVLLGLDEAALQAIARVGAARCTGGWLAVEPAWEARAEALAAQAANGSIDAAARALVVRFEQDAWAQARAAELFVRTGAWRTADHAHTRALTLADGSLARRELVGRWMNAVGTLPREAQLPLRILATERALGSGEAEEAFNWAQSAATLAPHDADVSRLFGRAAVIVGDLVAAKVALERSAQHATDDVARAIIAAELAEVAYLAGDLTTARHRGQARDDARRRGDDTARRATRSASSSSRARGTRPTCTSPRTRGARRRPGCTSRSSAPPEPRHRAPLQAARSTRRGQIFEAVLAEGERTRRRARVRVRARQPRGRRHAAARLRAAPSAGSSARSSSASASATASTTARMLAQPRRAPAASSGSSITPSTPSPSADALSAPGCRRRDRRAVLRCAPPASRSRAATRSRRAAR